MRPDKRKNRELRPVKIKKNFNKYAEGSALIELGDTKVICTASIEEKVPSFLRNKGKGWITAEYGMLPRSVSERIIREASRGKIAGRTHEIQRLIGRSLRSVVDLDLLGERTLWIDCDVIQADGGTRTAAITGAFIALVEALKKLHREKTIERFPVKDWVAATSVGIKDGELMLDLSYREDSSAEVDMNVVMTGRGKFIEIQGTAERHPFALSDMEKLVNLARQGIKKLISIQKSLVGAIL